MKASHNRLEIRPVELTASYRVREDRLPSRMLGVHHHIQEGANLEVRSLARHPLGTRRDTKVSYRLSSLDVDGAECSGDGAGKVGGHGEGVGAVLFAVV